MVTEESAVGLISNISPLEPSEAKMEMETGSRYNQMLYIMALKYVGEGAAVACADNSHRYIHMYVQCVSAKYMYPCYV